MVEKLSQTIYGMISPDYKERFKAEYYQLAYRYNRLKEMVDNWETLDFTPSCPKELLEEQLSAMENYLVCLEKRASIENIYL